MSPAFDPEIFRSRFLALRRADRLGDAEHARLEALFAAHAELARAWGMLQELHTSTRARGSRVHAWGSYTSVS